MKDWNDAYKAGGLLKDKLFSEDNYPASIDAYKSGRIAMLEALHGRLTTCIGCGCLSLRTCALLNPDDEAGSLGGGAHYLRKVSPRG